MSPRADAVRNRAKILEVAARVFAEQGAAASTEQVAAEAGVAIGTIFRHFPTKADLLAAIMKDTLVGESIDRFREVVAGLLGRAQERGEVRAEIGADEVMALLVAVCQGALRGGWSSALQRRTLSIVFDGRRPAAAPVTGVS